MWGYNRRKGMERGDNGFGVGILSYLCIVDGRAIGGDAPCVGRKKYFLMIGDWDYDSVCAYAEQELD